MSVKSQTNDDVEIEKGDIIMYEDGDDFEFYKIAADYSDVSTKYDYELINIKNKDDQFVVSGVTLQKMLGKKFRKVDMKERQIKS